MAHRHEALMIAFLAPETNNNNRSKGCVYFSMFNLEYMMYPRLTCFIFILIFTCLYLLFSSLGSYLCVCRIFIYLCMYVCK